MSQSIQPIPVYAPVLNTRYVGSEYYYYLSQLQGVAQGSSTRLGSPLSLTGQSASITTTAFTIPALTGTAYQVSWYMAVTTPAGVNSSLTLTIGYTDGASAKTLVTPAMTSNAIASPSGGAFTFQADQASPITYAFAYASNPASAMIWKAYLVVSQLV